MPEQLKLELDTRRQLLRRIKTGSPHVKHLLRVIDDRCGDKAECWPSVRTLAADMEVSERTVQRAIEAAVKQDLLVVLPPNEVRKSNTFRIRWAEMRDRTRQQEDEERARRRMRSEGVTQCHPPGVTVSPPRCQTDTPPVSQCHPKNPLKPQTKPPLKPCGNDGGDGDLKSGQGGVWTVITLEQLGDLGQVQRLYAHALRRRWVRADDRVRFFAAARSVFRRASGLAGPDVEPIDNPGAAFTRIVKRRMWLGSDADEDWAHDAINRIDPKPAPPPRTSALDQVEDVDATRKQQIAAMLEKIGRG